jgi:DNA-binding FadR family transcriptional regulator
LIAFIAFYLIVSLICPTIPLAKIKDAKSVTDSLGSIKDILLSKYYRGENQTSEDWQFHSMIYSFARNKTMAKLITGILEAIEVFWNHPLDMPDPFTETIPLHGELYNAMCQRNVKLAQTINDEILDRVRTDIQNNM